MLGVPHELGDDEQEREDAEPQHERPGHLAKDVAVENAHERSRVESQGLWARLYGRPQSAVSGRDFLNVA